MKGIIKKQDNNWIVVWSNQINSDKSSYEFPLHPSDVEQINLMKNMFDNIEARILSQPTVEFELGWWLEHSEHERYAKLKPIKTTKSQTSIEYFHDAVIDMMARRRPINTNEAAKILMEAQKLHEQEIIDAWVDSAQYGMKQDDIDIMDSDEPQLAQIYYDNKYGK